MRRRVKGSEGDIHVFQNAHEIFSELIEMTVTSPIYIQSIALVTAYSVAKQIRSAVIISISLNSQLEVS